MSKKLLIGGAIALFAIIGIAGSSDQQMPPAKSSAQAASTSTSTTPTSSTTTATETPVETEAPIEPAAPAGSASSSCDSNYSGACVPIASDVDCGSGSGNGPSYLYGTATVVGSDIY